MPSLQTIPDIRTVIDPLLGQPYEDADCWNFVRHVYQLGFGIMLVRDTQLSAQQFQEVWYRGDAAEPLDVVHPWDLLLLTNDEELPVTMHVGIVVDTYWFVHARPSETGVALGRLRTWKPRLIQVARLRELI